MEGLLKEKSEVNQISHYYDEAKNFLKNNGKLSDCLGINIKQLKRNKSTVDGWKHIKCTFDYDEEPSNRITEKRICKCFYYRNNGSKNRICQKEKCEIKIFDENFILNNCDVLDYEIPVNYVADKIGEFDLLIKYENENYALEVKPPKSKETLLRMITEILTYDFCNCYKDGSSADYNHKERGIIQNKEANKNNKLKTGIKYNLGIAFFDESAQHKKFKELIKNKKYAIIRILNKYNISVFNIKRESHVCYTIEKIYPKKV